MILGYLINIFVFFFMILYNFKEKRIKITNIDVKYGIRDACGLDIDLIY